MLAARLDLLEKKPDAAERRLLDIIQAQPSRLDAYELLGEIYLKQGQIDSALDKYRTMAGHAPEAAGPPTMIGMILERRAIATGRDGSTVRCWQSILVRRLPRTTWRGSSPRTASSTRR